MVLKKSSPIGRMKRQLDSGWQEGQNEDRKASEEMTSESNEISQKEAKKDLVICCVLGDITPVKDNLVTGIDSTFLS